jgi:SnoaL-like domain
MSANLELVESIVEPWARGDFSNVEWAHEDIEFVIADGPEPGGATGLAAMAGMWLDFMGAWEDLRAEPQECRELDGERVVVYIRNRGRGKTSGLELGKVIGESWADLFVIREHKVARLVLYRDRERALVDLGLAEER